MDQFFGRLGKVGAFMKSAFQFIFCFRKAFLAIPVLIAAIIQAKHNMAELGTKVGIILESSGTYSTIITRGQAVVYPFLLTCLCLVCMFCSRKAFYPWLIAVVTLAIPTVILVLNQLFPIL